MSDYSNWSDDDLDEEEYPDEDSFSDDETATRECPRCGVDIYEDAEQCPLCGHWITPDTSPWSGRSGWWIVLGAVGTLALILSLLFIYRF
ncbi:MAG: zinc ribbon domain-containing protein [Planctomycetota bacterium]|nr:zinc ribbon domain-containing protein [Planctomycetota bacterium]